MVTSTESAKTPGLVLFMGMVRRGEFENLQKRGLPLGIIVDVNSKARIADVSKFAVVEKFDFSKPVTELIGLIRKIQEHFTIGCLYNVIELYVDHTAEAASALGLAGLSPASARLCLDKSLMRQRFLDRIGPSAAARFRSVHSESDLLQAAGQFSFPCFLQPANVSASMWATRNADVDTLLTNYRRLMREAPTHHERVGKRDTPLGVVLAEYLQGANTSVDCLMDRTGQVYHTPLVDVLTGKDIGIDDFHHFARILPSQSEKDQIEELNRLATAGVQALDMTSSAAHVEFIGSRLGEIGARPGGNRPRILEMAYGIDLLGGYYQILRGEKPDLRGDRDLAAAIVTPFPPREGALRSIRHLDRIINLPGYHYHEVRAKTDQKVGPSKEGYRAGLYVELISPDASQLRDTVNLIASWTDIYELT